MVVREIPLFLLDYVAQALRLSAMHDSSSHFARSESKTPYSAVLNLVFSPMYGALFTVSSVCPSIRIRQRIVHGTMTFAAGIGVAPASKINLRAFTYEHLRFPKPMFIGDTICTHFTVAAVKPDLKRADGVESQGVSRC